MMPTHNLFVIARSAATKQSRLACWNREIGCAEPFGVAALPSVARNDNGRMSVIESPSSNPMRPILLIALAAFLAAPTALAQKSDHPHHRRAESVIDRADSLVVPTGLSADAVLGLREGRGMGLARPAELHSYPGPMHVLELADALDLTAEQRAEAERLMRDVKAEARALGEQIVERERHLDRLFASGKATPEAVDRVTTHIAETQGRLRAAHLRAHVAMRGVLTPDQIAAYDRLRGYTD